LDPPTGKAVFPESSDSSLGVAKKNVVVAGDDVEKLSALPTARVRMSGSNRLAFAMPAEEAALGFNIEAILDACRRWPIGGGLTCNSGGRPIIGGGTDGMNWPTMIARCSSSWLLPALKASHALSGSKKTPIGLAANSREES
jgi:hypothetical protein